MLEKKLGQKKLKSWCGVLDKILKIPLNQKVVENKNEAK